MKRHFIPSLLLGCVVVLSGCKQKTDSSSSTGGGGGGTPAANPSADAPFAGGRKTSFAEVTSQLDPGGTFYLYLSTDQWLAGLSKKVTELRGIITAIAHPQPEEAAKIDKGFQLAGSIIQRSGIEDLTGVGLSAAPVGPGLYRNKFIMHHPSGAGSGFMWSLFGKEAHPLTGLSLMPSTTALAIYGDLDVLQLLKVIEEELTKSGIPQVVEMVKAFPQIFEQKTQLSWPRLVGSLGGESGAFLTLDSARKVTIPMGDVGDMEIPAPGLVIAIKVKDDLLYDFLSSKLKENPETKTTSENGLKICAMAMPNPINLPLQLTVASSGDYLFLASSAELVRTVQQVRTGKQPGLKASSDFQDLARHMPAEGNQFVYVSKNLGEVMTGFQRQALSQSGIPPQQIATLQRLLGGGPSYSLSIGAHGANGWQTTSVGNQDTASSAMLLPAVAVAALAAGMILPALSKAKSRAQSINSVSNVKQLGLATRMYTSDHGDKFPPAASWCDAIQENVMTAKPYKAANDSSPGRCSYAFNAKIGGLAENKVAGDTVMLFESEAGWNKSGGLEMLLSQPREGGQYVIGFADGSVRRIAPAQVQALRWNP